MENVDLKNETPTFGNTVLPAVPISEGKTWFDEGDKILYQYTHHLNSRSTTEIVKEGIFIRRVKRKGSVYDWDVNQKCVVKLNGNKNTSTIRMTEIRHCR